MKILVIGRTGQLAQSLSELAGIAALPLTTLGRPEIDLLERSSIVDAITASAPELVINAAAYTAVDKAEAEPELARALNASAPSVIAEQCAQRDIPLIHISTDYVFDGAKEGAYTEADRAVPATVYGRTKLDGEAKVMANCEKHLILRTAWIFSPFGNNFVKTMLRLATNQPEIKVVDDQVGSPTYALHLAAAILSLTQRIQAAKGENLPWGIYNAVADGRASWCDLARETFVQSAQNKGPAAIVRPISSSEYPTPAKRPANSCLDGARLRDKFGLTLPHWHIGIRQCVERLCTDGTAP